MIPRILVFSTGDNDAESRALVVFRNFAATVAVPFIRQHRTHLPRVNCRLEVNGFGGKTLGALTSGNDHDSRFIDGHHARDENSLRQSGSHFDPAGFGQNFHGC